MDSAPEWISAFGTVVALLAAVYAIRQQGEELRLQRAELSAQREELARTVAVQQDMVQVDRLLGYLDIQVRLNTMVMNDPSLRSFSDSAFSDVDAVERNKMVYINLWFRLLRAQFLYGDLSPDQLRLYIRSDFFVDEFGLKWWNRMRLGYQEEAESRAEIEFVDHVDRTWADAHEDLDIDVGGAPSADQ